MFSFLLFISFLHSFSSLAVILSNYYDLPFNDILDWRKFSVILNEIDVYRLKHILKNISDAEFGSLHNNLIKVNKQLPTMKSMCYLSLDTLGGLSCYFISFNV